MQQTKTYQLNKIDMDDTFSPAPLNENMDKLDATLSLLEGADGALRSRLATLEGHKFVVGSYKGTGNVGSSQTIQLGFTPRVVFLQCANGWSTMITQTYPNPYGSATIIENGFTVASVQQSYMNTLYETYLYLAIK